MPLFTNVVRVAQVDSTNRLAADLARAGAAEGLVVVADEQIDGRGRRGRRWDAPPGAGLLVSVLVRRHATPAHAHLCVAALALGARAALEAQGCDTALKWPNDLVVPRAGGDAKIAGLLAEWAEPGALVVGLGCNLTWPAADAAALPPGATTLEAVTGRAPARDALLFRVLAEFEHRYLAVVAGEGAALVAERRARCATLGRRVRVERADGTSETGRALDVADDGRLLVDRGQDTVVIGEGDVVHLRDAAGN